VRRPLEGDDVAFTQNADAYLSGRSVDGWEAQEAVVQRMRHVANDARALGFVGLVSHGTALSLYVQHLGLAAARDFWMRLTTPDAWLVDGVALRRLGPEGGVLFPSEGIDARGN
jgi:hypothetical protein